MKRMIVTAAVAVAAVGGAGGALLSAWWPSARTAGRDGSEPVQQIVAMDPQHRWDTSDQSATGGPPAGSEPTARTSSGGGTSAGAGTSSGTASGSTAGGSGTAARTAGTGGSTASAGSGSTGSGSGGSGSIGSGPPSGCHVGAWDPRVQGRPVAFAGGERAGDYLWHNLAGFHLAVTHRGDRRDVFTGTIHADAPMALHPVRLEGRDTVALSADRHDISFRFYDYGHIDGVDFVTDCATRLVVGGLRMNGAPLPAARVYLGATRAHPAGVPFTLTRAPASAQ